MWSPDSRFLYFRRELRQLWRVRPPDGEPAPVTDIGFDPWYGFDPEDGALLVARDVGSTEIVAMDVEY